MCIAEPYSYLCGSGVLDEEGLSLDDQLLAIIAPFHMTDTESLRSVMKETGAVLSGSAALALMDAIRFFPTSLDFFVPSAGYASFLRFVEDFGYQITGNAPSVSDIDAEYLVVVKVVHPVSKRIINVATRAGEHVVHIITKFYSTVAMNFVAYYGLVSLYPLWTTRTSGLILADTSNARLTLKEYERKGFRFLAQVGDLPDMSHGHRCYESPYCPLTTRTLHDEFCFHEPFDEISHPIAFYEPAVTWSLSSVCQ